MTADHVTLKAHFVITTLITENGCIFGWVCGRVELNTFDRLFREIGKLREVEIVFGLAEPLPVDTLLVCCTGHHGHDAHDETEFRCPIAGAHGLVYRDSMAGHVTLCGSVRLGGLEDFRYYNRVLILRYIPASEGVRRGGKPRSVPVETPCTGRRTLHFFRAISESER